ncbi:MAG: VWA domain-containing protein, partial [Anaerolineales bacterium]|nr:VWA domain-containing protein [Anaerolineales bacterium]
RRPTRARFWSVLALRLLLLTLIVLALAGIQLRLSTDMLTAVFLLDVSDSIPVEEQTRGEELIRQAISAMPDGDRAAVVVFGQDALVERLATEDSNLPGFTSVPLTFRTDISAALQLGLALFPDQGAKRMVLLSDGRQNLGKALEQAELAAAHDIELSYIPLEVHHGEVEVFLDGLESPADVRQGQRFDLTAVIQSSAPVSANLRVFADGQLFYSQEVNLQSGTNRFLIPVEPTEPGFQRFRAQIIPDADTLLQNNEASAFTIIHGPAQILVVEGVSGEAANLVSALRSTEMDVTLVSPANLPTTLPELTNFETIILANVPAEALPTGVMQTLQSYTRDMGRGLLMTGGETAFGAGGYLRSPLEEALPVYMDVRTRELSANLALVLAVDKSGSMGRCHCDDPDLNQSYIRQEVGQPKVDIAKEAVMRATGALGEQDFLGVVAFDDSASWALSLDYLVDLATIEREIGGIQAFGGTNILSGVEIAYNELVNADASRKHIILLTDGWTHGGDVRPLAREMAEQGITLSVVAAGSGSAEYLEDLARTGSGRYYPAEDIMTVPDFFLKDTVQAVGHYIIEEAFFPLPSRPGPALQGLDTAALPLLFGYNGTSPKNTARIELATPRGDPLLATWQYGLGRAAAWTSDLKGQWALDWVSWDGYAQFVSQLVGWLLPVPQAEGFQAQAGLQDGLAIIDLEAVDQDGYPLNFLGVIATLVEPDLTSREIHLTQVGAGTYQSSVDLTRPGAYLINVAAYDNEQPLSQQTFGLVVPYSPEYRQISSDLPFLQQLARITGGSQLIEPTAAFIKNLPAADYAREIWRPLLIAVALLFPIDIALRRVTFSSREYAKAVDWLRQRMPTRQPAVGQEGRTLDHLFQARQRARLRRSSSSKPDLSPQSGQFGEQQPKEQPSVSQKSETPPTSEDTLTRLRDAKRRARKD